MDAKQWAERIERLLAEKVLLTERLERLSERVDRLEAEVEDIKRRPAQSIGSVEYRFDQLKIDTLQGTLHIGIRPEDAAGEPIWKLGGADVPQPKVVPAAQPTDAAGPQEAAGLPSQPPSPFLNIREAVHRHIAEAVPPLLLRLSEAADYDIEPEEIDRVVADLHAQADARIAHYMKVSEYDATRERPAFEGSVTDLTIRDVDTAIRDFVAGKRPPPNP